LYSATNSKDLKLDPLNRAGYRAHSIIS